MILLHQQEVDLLKTVILFPASSPSSALHLEGQLQPDSLDEVALQTYIMHCFAGWYALRALGPLGC